MECNRGGETLVDNNIFWDSRFYQPPETPAVVSIAEDNAHWNDPFDAGTVSGDGVHGDGTDDLHLAHNLIGRMDGAGYSQNVVQFRMHSGRGGTRAIPPCATTSLRLPPQRRAPAEP